MPDFAYGGGLASKDTRVRAQDFRFFAVEIAGTETDWLDAIARKLRIDVDTVQAWLAADAVPACIEARLADLIVRGRTEPTLDAWVVGASAEDPERRYVVHLHAPRFVARIANGSKVAGRTEAGRGHVWPIDDTRVLSEVVWLDQPPESVVETLLEAAATAARRG